MKNKKGFTLVELLVVIAIIGILSTVAVVALGNARQRARIAATQANLSNMVTQAVLCHDADQELTTNSTLAPEVPCVGAQTPVEGGQMCDAVTGNWPTLPTTGDWSYMPNCDSSRADGEFLFAVSTPVGNTGDNTRITCTQNGCTTTAPPAS